jgi:hypothetical protein
VGKEWDGMASVVLSVVPGFPFTYIIYCILFCNLGARVGISGEI